MIKKILFLCLAAGWLMAEIVWQPSYRVALEEAKKQNKPMMVLLVSHTCKWCRKLENRTLQNPEIVAFVNKHFVPVIVYREDRNFPTDRIRSSLVPTTFFLTPDEKNLIKPVMGYWEPMDYMTDLQMAVKKFKKRQAPAR
ncbi:thioredoxin family protein [Hydrogenimonas sp.]